MIRSYGVLKNNNFSLGKKLERKKERKTMKYFRSSQALKATALPCVK